MAVVSRSSSDSCWDRTVQTIESFRHRDGLVAGTQMAAASALVTAATCLSPAWSMTFRGATILSTYGLTRFYGGKEGGVTILANLPEALRLTRSLCKPAPQADAYGQWQGAGIDVRWSQFFDSRLADEMALFLTEKGVANAWDFGCGPDAYSKVLLEKGIFSNGLDGNPATLAFSNGTGAVQNLAAPFERGVRDCVISLEVGAKIPRKYEGQFLENICNHARKWIILSWPVNGQKGPHQLNCHDNGYIIEELKKRGWELDGAATKRLRDGSSPIYYWFQDTLMVFKKKEG